MCIALPSTASAAEAGDCSALSWLLYTLDRVHLAGHLLCLHLLLCTVG